MSNESKQMIVTVGDEDTASFKHHENPLLRALRLQIFTQHLPWKKRRENPKIAIFKNRKVAFLHATLHIVPLAASLVLIYFNTHGFFIGSMSTTALTTIQFTAKIQEVLVQASLAAIMLAVIRHQILGPGGLPLGSFLAPSRAGDVSYLWSIDLWGSLTSKCLHGWRRIFLSVFIPVIIVLTAIVGPSTAVLMIPRFKGYPYDSWMVIMDGKDTLYPQNITLENVKLSAEKLQKHYMDQIILGDRDGYYTFADENVTRLVLSTDFSSNTFSASTGTYISPGDCPPYESISTLPSRALSGVLTPGANYEFPVFARTDSYQAVVGLECPGGQQVSVDEDLANQFVDFGSCYPEYNNQYSLADVRHNMTDPDTLDVFHWVSAPRHVATPSSLVLIRGSWTTHSSANTSADSGNDTSNLYYTPEYIQPCLITAFWAKSRLNSTGTNDGTGFALDIPDLWDNVSPLISISPQWAETITNVSVTYRQGSYSESQYQRLLAWALSDTISSPTIFSPIDWDEIRNGVEDPEYGYSLLPSYGMTRKQYDALHQLIKERKLEDNDRLLQISTTTNWTDPETLTYQSYVINVDGYGYDSSEFTVQVSLGIVGAYCLVAIVFLGWLFVKGNTSCSWDSTSELFMLGLNSHYPSHLGSTSAGVECLKTMREPVRIQFNEEKQRLQMVFTNDIQSKTIMYDDVRVNKAY